MLIPDYQPVCKDSSGNDVELTCTTAEVSEIHELSMYLFIITDTLTDEALDCYLAFKSNRYAFDLFSLDDDLKMQHIKTTKSLAAAQVVATAHYCRQNNIIIGG